MTSYASGPFNGTTAAYHSGSNLRHGRAIQAGRSPRNSLPEEGLFEVGIVPGGGEPPVRDPHLQGGVVLQQAQRRAAEDAEVRVGVPLADSALVLLERHVELPMQPVLDRPMAPYRGAEPAPGELLAQEVIPH